MVTDSINACFKFVPRVRQEGLEVHALSRMTPISLTVTLERINFQTSSNFKYSSQNPAQVRITLYVNMQHAE